MKPFVIRCAAALALVLVLPLRADEAAPASPGFVESFKAATQAYQARDYAAMERHLRAALERRPAHPAALYRLAAALALRGERLEAARTLESLAAMGLAYDAENDADFAALRGTERFAGIVREFARNRRPAGRTSVAFQLLQPTFIPEGIAYDADSKAFFVGGVHERRIQRVRSATGKEDDFVPPGGGGLWAPLGMAADEKRRLLWVASAAIPQMKNAQPDEIGRSAILAYDLDSGRIKRRYVMGDEGTPHRLGDLVVARDGKIYASDSKAGRLYVLDTAGGEYRALTPPGALASPQGLVLSRDREWLYVADYTQGLYRYRLDDGKLERLEVAPEICVYGIDGLYRHEDDLIAIQNGIAPHRVVRLRLERGGRRVRHARVLAANLEHFDEPTLGVLVGRRFHFVANSQWNKFDAQHKLPPDEQLRRPAILSLTLEDEPEERRDPGPGRERAPAPGSPGLPLPVCPGPLC